MAEISFGEWLKRRRKAGGWTQQELALQISCSTSALKKFEAEARRPSAQIVERLAEIFEIPADERTAFLRFARGDWRESRAEVMGEAPWHASTASTHNNLPVPPTALIGREHEIADLCGYLSDPGIRLITLIGPPGIGKTRLSLAVAHQCPSEFTDGVSFVALAPVQDPSLLAPTIHQALGFAKAGDSPPLRSIIEGIGKKRILLLLDNLEHIVEGIAPLVSELVLGCPNVKILTTSREVLRVPGEWVYPVPALDTPKEPSAVDMDTIARFPALKLFAERARAVRPDFALSTENIRAVAAICSQLDGLPLAIELIAARIRLMSPEFLLTQMSDQFVLSADGMRAISARQKTLHNAIDWSYKLLSREEQKLFARLSVFSGGFTLEAAESMFSRIPAEKTVSELVTLLLDKSLLQRIPDHASRREPRFTMLVTIQQFAQQRLRELQAESETRDWHLEYFLELAEQANEKIHAAEQVRWMDRLELELDNLRAALSWSMDKPSAGPVLWLAGALAAFWSLRAYWSEGAGWLDQALSKAWQENNETEKIARTRALYHRANLAHQLDQLDTLKISAEAALELGQELGDRWGVAYSRALIGIYLRRSEYPSASKEFFEQSLKEFHELNDAWAESFVLAWLAGISGIMGTPAEYLAIKQRGIVCARRSGDRDLLAGWLVVYASDHISERNWDQAEELLQEAEQLYQEMGSSFGVNLTRFRRAMSFLGHRNYEEAKVMAKHCLEFFLQAGEKNLQSETLILLLIIAELKNDTRSALEYAYKCRELQMEIRVTQAIGTTLVLGRLLYQEGERESGKQYLLQSLTSVIRADIDVDWWQLDAVFGQMALLFLDQQTPLAVEFLAVEETLFQARSHNFGDIVHDLYYDRVLPNARAKLSEAEFTAAWENGSRMRVEEALDLALETVREI